MKSIPATEFKKLLEQNAVKKLVDVRTKAEFEERHVVGAVNIPLGELTADAVSDGSGPVYVLCQSGVRARRAQEQLISQGVADVICVDGGTVAAAQAGVALALGARKTISLERQVRIVAGALVFFGSLLTVLISPYFIIVPLFVGAGLIFAGVTDWCGMALLLEKMPWNRA